MSDQEQKVKVSDRRMFTPDGELREEYRFLEDKDREKPPEAEEPAPTGASPETPDATGPVSGPPTGAAPGAQAPEGMEEAADGPPLELPSNAGQPGAPGFMDLVAMLAEPASIYLGDAPLPDGRTHEDLDMARVHIDLLDVLRQKTAGNLSSRESAVLEDVVYQLKMRYVRKQG
ncbi:MAG: DUF1844 domain-containing protein [Acidobacteriota bacterium]|nr:DUF1844 domain-containing protein [Acidobacteriota bacterium]